MVYFKNLFSIVSFWLPKWNKVEKSELKRRQWRQIATIPNSVKLCYVSCFFFFSRRFCCCHLLHSFGVVEIKYNHQVVFWILFNEINCFRSRSFRFVECGICGRWRKRENREREQANWNDTMQVQSEQKAETKCYLIEWLHIKLLLFNQRSRKIKSQNDVFQLFGLWSHLYASRNICITMGLSRW